MTAGSRLVDHRGFTLMELLIVVAILGMVITAVLGVYKSTQRTAYTQDEVVEVQQNLRVSLDQISRDLRDAGFMVNGNAISVATGNTLTMQTAAMPAVMARIVAPTSAPFYYTTPADTATERQIKVASSDMVDLFDSGASGDWVRIIRPPNQTEPLNDTFQISHKDSAGPTLTLKDFGTENIIYKPGDIIVKVPSQTSSLPRTVSYSLSGEDLIRNDGANRTLASKLTGLNFDYLMDDGSETDTVTGSDLADIRAVRVNVIGATSASQTGSDEYGTGGVRTRELSTVVVLRNR